MKKYFKLILMLVIMIGVTGCAKFNVNMEIGEDKHVTLEIIYGLVASSENFELEENDSLVIEDDSLTEEEKENIIADDSWKINEEAIDINDYRYLENHGFKVEKFTEETNEGTLEGVKLIKIYKNIDYITKDEKVIVNFNDRFNYELYNSFDDSYYFYKIDDKYVANFIFDFSEEGEQDFSSLDPMFDLEYKIKLPKKSISNNATKISEDGKELSWDLKYGEVNEVNFEFDLEKDLGLNIILITIGSCLFIGLVVGIIVYRKNKRIVKNN